MSEQLTPANVSDEQIDAFTLSQAHHFVKENKIPIAKTEIKKTLDLKCAIKLHIAKIRGRTAKDTASQMLLQLRKEDNIRTADLTAIVNAIRSSSLKYLPKSSSIHEQLNINLPNYKSKIEEFIVELQKSHCPVLVIGESSAGKSSFINVLLGEDLLPCYHLSNTSVICEIRYGEEHHALIYPWEEGVDIVTLSEKELDVEDRTNRLQIRAAFTKALAFYIQEREDRDKGWKYKRAIIKVPCEVLKTGLSIIDSPGIGENEELTKLVLDYMFQSFAFVYVINSMNAGGLQSDRVQKIVRELVEHKKKEKFSHFIPEAALFICNKWDLVSPLDRPTVLKATKDKLKNLWPGFQESQVYCLSTMESTYMMRNNHTSEQLYSIVQGLQTMIPHGLEGRLVHVFDYFKYLVHRVKIAASSYLKQKKLTEMECQELIRKTQERLKTMKQDSEDFFKKHREELENSKHDAITAIKEYFETPAVHSKICKWKQTDIPKFSSWREVELSIRAKTYEKISNAMTQFEEENGLFRQKRQTMLNEFRKKFMELEKKLVSIETALAGDDPVTVVPGRDVNARNTEEISILSILGFGRWKTSTKVLFGLTAPILAPIAFAGLIVSLPVLGLMKVKETIMVYKIREKTQEYNNDPRKFMSRYSEEILKKFLSDSNLKIFVKEELHVVYQFINQLEEAESKQRESYHYLVNKLSKKSKMKENKNFTVEDDDGDISGYENLQKIYEEYYNKLQCYEVTKLLRRDVESIATNIADCLPKYIAFRQDKVVCYGINATIFEGTFSKPGSDSFAVAIRKQRKPLSWQNIKDYLNEERAYRHAVDNYFIIRLMTITKDMERVYQIFTDIECSLREHVRAKKAVLANRQDWRRFTLDVASSIAKGLAYMHRAGCVHFDLSMDTIAVTVNGRVQLTNLTYPKKIDEDCHQHMMSTIKREYLYLPHEVVGEKRHAYSANADVYSFGLILWELSTKQVAFEDILSDPHKHINTTEDFFDCLRMAGPVVLLNVIHRDDISDQWKYIIKNALNHSNPDIQLKVTQIEPIIDQEIDELDETDDKP